MCLLADLDLQAVKSKDVARTEENPLVGHGGAPQWGGRAMRRTLGNRLLHGRAIIEFQGRQRQSARQEQHRKTDRKPLYYTSVASDYKDQPFDRIVFMGGKTMRYPTLSVLVVSVSISLIISPSLHAADPDTQGVQAALTAYHEALNKLFTGDAAPMKTVWSHADDVTYMGPAGGMLHGWPQVEQYWDRQAAKKLLGKVDPDKAHVFAGQTLAVVCYHEHGEHVFDGKPQPVSIRATTTFRKEDGQWKVIGHHTDTLAEYLKK